MHCSNLQHFPFHSFHSSYRAPLCCEPLWLTLPHLALLDRGRLVHMCTLTGWCHTKIIPTLFNTNNVSSLSSIPTWDIALKRFKTKQNIEISTSVSLYFLMYSILQFFLQKERKTLKCDKRLQRELNKSAFQT